MRMSHPCETFKVPAQLKTGKQPLSNGPNENAFIFAPAFKLLTGILGPALLPSFSLPSMMLRVVIPANLFNHCIYSAMFL